MKAFAIQILILVPFFGFAQSSIYAISSYREQVAKAPNTHYIGEAWLGSLVQDDGEMNYNIGKATFRSNSTLDWHKHTTVQILIILRGEGYYQERGKEAVIVKKGDVVKCNKDIEHWHSSTKDSSVTYLAIYGGAKPTTWTEKLSQEYYDSVAQKLKEGKK